MGSEVAVLYCDTYEEEAVYQKLRRGLWVVWSVLCRRGRRFC